MVYREMASIYDRLMDHAPYDLWYSFTNDIIAHFDKPISSIADLGCGTGEITTRLARDGYDMYGIDYSSDMLSIAEQKATEQGLKIQWLQQDLRNLTGLHNLDAAVSYCDVINYIISVEDVRKAFQQTAQILKKGGLFIFDVHSLYHVDQTLTNQTFADVSDDFSYIWFCSAGNEVGEMHHDLTFFSFDGKKYDRFDEYHHQKTYSIEVYQQLLKETGFQKAKIFSDFSCKIKNSHKKAERIFFVTEKI